VTVYSVYEPPAKAPDVLARAESLRFVKQGFSWPALFVPGLWLLYQRMWLELILFVALFGVLAWLLGQSEQGQGLLGWLSLGLVVLFAAEASDLRGASLERRGWTQAGAAVGPSRDAAELAFFRSWLPTQERPAPAPEATAERQSPATRPRTGAEGEEVIGLFPGP